MAGCLAPGTSLRWVGWAAQAGLVSSCASCFLPSPVPCAHSPPSALRSLPRAFVLLSAGTVPCSPVLVLGVPDMAGSLTLLSSARPPLGHLLDEVGSFQPL